MVWQGIHNEFPKMISRMLFQFVFALLILGLADNKKSLAKTILANRFFLWLGTISYSIYMIHIPIGKVIHPFVDKIPDSTWIRILISIGLYAFVLAASWSIYKFFEVPSRNYVIKFFSKSKISNKREDSTCFRT
jgi:peptidoglycan/LPS O-acetylase OafA/YrhL